MVVTVGGLMIGSGIAVIAVTAVGSIFVAFAVGMSDDPREKMPWKWAVAGMLVGAVLVTVGRLSGL